MPVTFRPKITRGMTPERVQRRIELAQRPADVALPDPRPVRLSSLVWKPSVCVRTPVWNSLTRFGAEDAVPAAVHRAVARRGTTPLKKPQRAGPAVISEPYWFELNVRSTPQIAVAARRPVVERAAVVPARVLRRFLPREVVGEARRRRGSAAAAC